MRMYFLVILAALASLAGCNRSTPPATQPSGPRVVSMVPAATRTIVLIGATDTLVGVTQFDKLSLPENKSDVPVVGDYEKIDYERLVAVKPTAVVIQKSPVQVSQRLKDLADSHHFEIVNIRNDSIDDIWTVAKTMGRITGRADAAERAVFSAQQHLRAIQDDVKNRPHPKVVYMVTKSSLVGSNTFIDEMMALAGATNAGREVGRSWPQVNMEIVIKLQPEVLLVSAFDQTPQEPQDSRLEPWMRLPVPAVKNKRVYLVTESDSLMPTLDVPRGVQVLADLIHKDEPAPATQAEAATASRPATETP